MNTFCQPTHLTLSAAHPPNPLGCPPTHLILSAAHPPDPLGCLTDGFQELLLLLPQLLAHCLLGSQLLAQLAGFTLHIPDLHYPSSPKTPIRYRVAATDCQAGSKASNCAVYAVLLPAGNLSLFPCTLKWFCTCTCTMCVQFALNHGVKGTPC